MLAVAQVNWRARLLMIFQVLTNATRSPQEPPSSSHNFEQQDPAVPVAFDDEQSFRDWCERELATPSPWQVNLRGQPRPGRAAESGPARTCASKTAHCRPRSPHREFARAVAEFLHLFSRKDRPLSTVDGPSRETTQTGDASDETPPSRTCSLRVIAGQTQSRG